MSTIISGSISDMIDLICSANNPIMKGACQGITMITIGESLKQTDPFKIEEEKDGNKTVH